eukprot:Platyproteum_vivax@DN7394_c0_g1_i1.p1
MVVACSPNVFTNTFTFVKSISYCLLFGIRAKNLLKEFLNLVSSSESTLRLFEEPIDALDEWVWSGRGIDDMRDENIRTGGDDRRSGESVETRSLERSVETGDTWSMKRIMPSTPVQYPLSKRQETPVMYPWTPHRDLSKNNYNWNIPASYDTTV